MTLNEVKIRGATVQAMMQGVNPHYVQFLDIRVRRGNVLGDTLAQIESRRHELRKPLRVIFISGGVPEEGVDQARAFVFHIFINPCWRMASL